MISKKDWNFWDNHHEKVKIVAAKATNNIIFKDLIHRNQE